MKVYEQIAQTAMAIQNCEKSNNTEWYAKHSERLRSIESNDLPHGSGFDNGCTIDESNDARIVISCPYHCMNDGGYYDGWIDYKAIVKPSLAFGFDLRIVGRDYKGTGLKDYVSESIRECLDSEYKP